jgi:hypothetical protein
LAQTFKARVDDLVAWRPRPIDATPVYLRADSVPAKVPVPESPDLQASEHDEIDDLFLFGADK